MQYANSQSRSDTPMHLVPKDVCHMHQIHIRSTKGVRGHACNKDHQGVDITPVDEKVSTVLRAWHAISPRSYL